MQHSEDLCVLIQESIAWGRQLSDDAQEHVVQCSNCNEIALQFTSLDSLVEEAVDTSVPANFANKVMATIKGFDEVESLEAKGRVSILAGRIYGFRPFQYAAAGVAIFLGVVNLSQVLLSLLSAG